MHKQAESIDGVRTMIPGSQPATMRSKALRVRRRRICLGLSLLLSGLACWSPAWSEPVNEDDLLLLDFALDHQVLAASITGYAIGDRTLVSLAEAASALEFPILVEPEAGNASGWFIRQDRKFQLDLKGGYVEVEGKRQAVTPEQAFVHGDAVLVSVEAFSNWFPVNLKVNRATLTVDVVPRERLPVQERQARRSGARQVGGVGPATLPRIETPYQAFGSPAADIGLGYSIRRPENGKMVTGLNYSVLLAADAAYMDGKLYLSGNDNETLSNVRLSLSRNYTDLPLGLRYLELGDIVPVSVPGLASGGIERGVLIQGGGSTIGRDDMIDGEPIDISGDAIEGWDVELFQNGMRVGFQTVAANGRYDFQDIEPLSGENAFELVFHGPAGERRTERIQRYRGLAPDQPGSVRYQLSMSQKGEQFYQSDSDPARNLSDRGSARLAAGLDVRVLPWLSLRGAWNSFEVDGDRLNYTTVGARAGWRDLSLAVDARRDPLDGNRVDASVQVPASLKLWGFDTRLSHTHYAQSAGVNELTNLRLSSRTGLTLSGPIGQAQTRFSYFYNREPSRTSSTLSAGFTSRYQRLIFGNTLNYNRYGRDEVTGFAEDDRVDGNLFFSSAAYPLSVRGGTYYTLSPDTRARQYFLDANMRIANDMTVQFGLTHDPLTDVTRYSSGLNWQHPMVTLSPRIAYDSDGEYSGFVYASFSLAPRPEDGGLMASGHSLATSGAVVARVFLDHDASGTYNEGDEPLRQVKVQAPQAYRSAETDARGVAYLTTMSSERVTDVVLAQDTLPGPEMVSQHAGNSVQPRATAPVVIDFPVLPTGEVAGRVYNRKGPGQAPQTGVMVELRDSEGVVAAFKNTDSDGAYLFEGLPYGGYTLAVAGERGKGMTPRPVAIDAKTSFLSDIDLVLRSEVQAAQSPAQATMDNGVKLVQASAAPVSQQARARKSRDGRVAQLGAFASVVNARRHVQQLLDMGVLRTDEVDVLSDSVDRQTVFHRVIANPRSMTASAFCQSMKARGQQCMTILQ